MLLLLLLSFFSYVKHPSENRYKPSNRQRPLPRWLKWILRRLKVKLTDVTLRYESVGMCPLQVGSVCLFEGIFRGLRCV